MDYIDESMAPKLQSSDYSNGRFVYKIPDGYELDCVINDEIIIKPIYKNTVIINNKDIEQTEIATESYNN